MGRHRINVRPLEIGYLGGPRHADPYYCEWAVVVGDRVRRLRKAEELSLDGLCRLIHRPDGGRYSAGHLSRLERGYASAPLYFHLLLADALGVDPGRLLGPDDAQREVAEAEMTLLLFLRTADIAPHEAIARLARPDEQSS